MAANSAPTAPAASNKRKIAKTERGLAQTAPSWPDRPMDDRPAIIVVANSARALVASANRAGYAPLAVDVFGDSDTSEMSLAAITLEGGLADGLTPDKVAGAVEVLAAAYDPIGLVYGSGFEHQPDSIAAIEPMTRIIGNTAETVARATDPVLLSRICRAAHIQRPEIAFEPPDEPEGWLVKRRGGAGGAHIRAAATKDPAPPGCYFQRREHGRNISALFVADGTDVRTIGLSAQWTSPAPATPFRYGGAVGPVDVGAAQAKQIARAVARLTLEFGLVGLNSADFLVSADAVWLIEINPRPGATLDIFEPMDDALFAHHLAACNGQLKTPPSDLPVKAAQVVYAPRDIVLKAELDWPDWTADRPSPGTCIGADDPLCTVLAGAATADLARTHVEDRAREIMAIVEEWMQ